MTKRNVTKVRKNNDGQKSVKTNQDREKKAVEEATEIAIAVYKQGLKELEKH